MEKEIVAAVSAATAKPDYMTNDRIEALTKGHGMLNIAAMVAANVITEEILRGIDYKLSDASVAELPVEDIMKKAIESAKLAGADAANAALIVASLMYLAGTNARAGVPAGNRKLGAMARILAGADRAGVAAIPTPKLSNRLSAFAAVKAIYDALQEGKLTSIVGKKLPPFLAGGAIFGHSVLGEDIVFPELAINGAKIATEAMMNAYSGAGLSPSPFICAVLGAAAAMEIVHPDGFIGEQYGEFFVDTTSYLAGKSAAETAGLPEKMKIRGTEREFDTAHFIGDLALIFKDIGAPSVIGMMTFNEIMAALDNAIFFGAGFSGGPVNPPLGHLVCDAVIAMCLLIDTKGDTEKTAETLRKIKQEQWFDPEMATISMNTIARKAEQVRRGPVTDAMIFASEPVRIAGITKRAEKAYNMLKDGKPLEEITRELDDERKKFVEENASKLLSAVMGKDIKVKFLKLAGAARRSHPFVKQYWGFDSDIDMEVIIDGKSYKVEGLSHKMAPAAAKGELSEEWGLPVAIASAVAQELQYSGHTIINVTVPAAVAAAMGKYTWKDAGKLAEQGAYITGAIPGAKDIARKVAKLAVEIVKAM